MDTSFLKHFAAPYFSQVYKAMLGQREYLSVEGIREYMNLPEPIFQRVLICLNPNGDDRVDHDEFLDFFLSLTSASLDKRLQLIFRLYDVDFTECLQQDQLQLFLQAVPLFTEGLRFGHSFPSCIEAQMTRVEL